MSSAVRYHPLFRVRVREQGTGKNLRGIHCKPTARALTHMRNHRLVFKNNQPGFDVYFSTNPDAGNSVFGQISNPIILSFAMFTESPQALAEYEPSAEAGQQSQFYFDNLLASDTLHPGNDSPMSTGPSVSSNDGVRIYPHEFAVDTKDIAGADSLQIRHLVTNRVALSEPLELNPDKVDLSRPAIDLRHAESGPYRIAPTPGTSRKIYVDDQLARGNVLAAIDVHWRTPQDPAADTATYVVTFKRKAP